MSAQVTRSGGSLGFTVRTASRATLRTRPRFQRIAIRSWEYIPAVRVTVLALRLLAVMVLFVAGNALLSIANWWGLLSLAGAFAVLAIAIWVFRTAAKGWPVR